MCNTQITQFTNGNLTIQSHAHPNFPLIMYIAQNNSLVYNDPTWYTDLGVSHHVTSDPANLVATTETNTQQQ